MSDDACDFSIDGDYDGDAAEFIDTSEPKARKPHKCYECRREIPAGARYYRVTGKWDGEVESYCFCLACRDITDEFVTGSFAYGVLWEELQSNWEAGAPLQACLNRVTSVEAKQLMRDQWMKWKGLTS